MNEHLRSLPIIREDKGFSGTFYIGADNDRLAELAFSSPNSHLLIIRHVEVADKLKGQGIGTKLVQEAVDWVMQKNMKVFPICPFAREQFRKHPQWSNVLKQRE